MYLDSLVDEIKTKHPKVSENTAKFIAGIRAAVRSPLVFDDEDDDEDDFETVLELPINDSPIAPVEDRRDKILQLRATSPPKRQLEHRKAQDARIETINKKIQSEDPDYGRFTGRDKNPLDEKDRSNCGKTALHRAVDQNNLSAVQELYAKGASTKIKDNAGNTPRMIAVQNGFHEIAVYLKGR